MNTREFISRVMEASVDGLNDIYAVSQEGIDDSYSQVYFEITKVDRDDNGNVRIELTE